MKKTNSSKEPAKKPTRSAGFAGYESATRAFLKALGKQANRPVSALSPREVHALIARATRSKQSQPTVTAKPQNDQAAVLQFAVDLGARVGEVVQLKSSNVLLDYVLIQRSAKK